MSNNCVVPLSDKKLTNSAKYASQKLFQTTTDLFFFYVLSEENGRSLAMCLKFLFIEC